MSCGVCHVGGGQMEYDRDMNAYDPNSTSSDNRYFSFDRNKIVAGFMSSTNKAEIDCLMCHLNSSPTGANENGAGRAWYQTYNCGSGPGKYAIGPQNDPYCQVVGNDPNFGLPGAGPFTPGTAYDPINRNIALKALSFNYAPSLGIGAIVDTWGNPIAGDAITKTGGVDPTYQYINSIKGVPSTISGAYIQGTPPSQNCSACHARDDNAPGYPGMLSQVRVGYGNMISIMPAGSAIDVDQCTAAEVSAGNCPNPAKRNTVRWIEFGCKTGMGKRGQKIGKGPDDTWGMSMFNYMFGLNRPMGTPIVTETIPVTNPNIIGAGITSVSTKEKIPDTDVHDAVGFQCATCHYAIGSSKLGGAAFAEGIISNNPDGSVTIPAQTNVHGLNTAGGENTLNFGVNYPAETISGIDHQFAQGDDLKDTYGKNNLDSTVSCESCHITRTHPRVVKGEINPPTPTHSGFPAAHIEKISCTTCHIPELYVTPFRLKSRDWTLGFIKRGNETNGAFKNIYDWNFDMVTFRGDPITPLHQWATKYEKKQIVPVTPAEMPIWIALDNIGNGLKDKGESGSLDGVHPDDTSAIKTCTYGSRIFATCNSDADCPGGLCASGMTTYASPAKTRDVMKAAEYVQATQSQINPILRRASGNLNTGSIVPLFDGWPFPDGQGIDTKARIDAMVNAGAGQLLKIFHAPFDITHGIVPAEWALGGSKRGGCVSCHSSAQPRLFDQYGTDIGPNPNYSVDSVGFFEGAQHWMPQEMGVGNYDMMKNPFSFFADFDCTNIVNGLCSSDQMCMGMCMGMMHNSAANCQQFCGARATSCSGGTGPGGSFTDSDLFNQQGDPSNNFFLQQCIGFMQPNFDIAMGWPNGTAKVMGLMDGINGLQAFMLRETITGSGYGCNPMVGPKNVAIINMGGGTGTPQSIAQGTQLIGMMGDLNNCMPAAFGGTCTGAPTVPGYPATCVGGFRNGKGCIPLANMGVPGADNDADCNGTLDPTEATHNPFGLMLSRGEVRARFDLHLQQSKVVVPAGGFGLSNDNINTLWWPILTEQNPSNPSHLWAWDAAGSPTVCGAFQNEPCCTDQMGMPTPCADGTNVRTTLHANQLLGYSPAYWKCLISLVLNPGACGDAPVAKVAMQIDLSNPLQVNLDASASTNSNTYTWNFGDGNSGSGVKASHTYGAAGDYVVSLTVTGPNGPENTATSQVTLSCQPVAKIAMQIDPSNPSMVNLDASASTNASTYTWTFGDGTTATGVKASHTYAACGNYTVTLTVTGPCGQSKATSQVTISCQPVAKEAYTLTSVDYQVSFDGTASLHATSYDWDFGDATAHGSTAKVLHTYAAGGTYTACLTVGDGSGNTNKTCGQVIVDKLKPVARIKMQFDATLPRTVDFDGSTSLYAHSYSWNFGDGSPIDTTSGALVTHTYAPGTYYPKLTVTGITGLTNTTTAPVTIK